MSRTIEVDLLQQAFEEAKEKPLTLMIDNSRAEGGRIPLWTSGY